MDEKEKDKKRKKTKPFGTFLVGFVFCILALVGLVNVVSGGYEFTKKILNDDTQKQKFEKTILPILMLDPIPFDDPKALDEMTILRASLWSAIEENRSIYSYDDMGYMLVPATDVEIACARLFGKSIQPKHQSFSEGLLIRYIYDEEHLLYRVPLDAQSGYYLPRIYDISRSGDVYSLSVGYIPAGESYAVSVKGKKEEISPDKYMIYNLKDENGYYRLLSIKEDSKHNVYMPTAPTADENRLTELPLENSTSSDMQNIGGEIIGG